MISQQDGLLRRNGERFHGSYVVIGCSHDHPRCEKKSHSSCEDYFTIDRDLSTAPDFAFDLTGTLPETYKGRFQITLFEHLDWAAYNNDFYGLRIAGRGKQGFENALMMTHEDGFICIIGCPREQEYRNSIQFLNYFEIQIGNQYPHVIIPKNQNMTVYEAQQKIISNAEIKKIYASVCQVDLKDSLVFCTCPFEQMPQNGFKPLPDKWEITQFLAGQTRMSLGFVEPKPVFAGQTSRSRGFVEPKPGYWTLQINFMIVLTGSILLLAGFVLLVCNISISAGAAIATAGFILALAGLIVNEVTPYFSTVSHSNLNKNSIFSVSMTGAESGTSGVDTTARAALLN